MDRESIYLPPGDYYFARPSTPGEQPVYIRRDGSGQDVVLAALWAHYDELKVHVEVCHVCVPLADDGSASTAHKVCVTATVHFPGERARAVHGREGMRLVSDRQDDSTVRH